MPQLSGMGVERGEGSKAMPRGPQQGNRPQSKRFRDAIMPSSNGIHPQPWQKACVPLMHNGFPPSLCLTLGSTPCVRRMYCRLLTLLGLGRALYCFTGPCLAPSSTPASAPGIPLLQILSAGLLGCQLTGPGPKSIAPKTSKQLRVLALTS